MSLVFVREYACQLQLFAIRPQVPLQVANFGRRKRQSSCLWLTFGRIAQDKHKEIPIFGRLAL